MINILLAMLIFPKDECTEEVREEFLSLSVLSLLPGIQTSATLTSLQSSGLVRCSDMGRYCLPAPFQAFDMVLRLGRNSTLSLLREEFPGLVGVASSAVTQLFLDMSLYILGSDANVDDMVTSFFSRLFPLTFRRLLGNSAMAGISEDCLRGAWRQASAFGSYPKLMMTRLSRSLLSTRAFLQALNLGIEVVNTTQHMRAGKDCGRALLRLWYCPHCQGHLDARPCRALCVSTMTACLGGAGDVQPHWRAYVEELGSLAAAMRGEQDIEAVVLRLHVIVRLALRHAVGAKSKVNAQVSGVCARAPQRVARAATSPAKPAAPVSRSSQSVNFDPDETLSGRRREFILSLRGFSLFYGGLGEALCSREPATLNSSLCWNGQEVTEKFPGPGLKRPHPHVPDTKHKPPEPVISQIIDKLKHINQSCLSGLTWCSCLNRPERQIRDTPEAQTWPPRGHGGGPEVLDLHYLIQADLLGLCFPTLSKAGEPSLTRERSHRSDDLPAELLSAVMAGQLSF
ncbi:hypothetical protein P4O66_003784 [Electrophorus voltai]|uniref:Glypican-3 n=1 Tax=Electrophorus voltai TaxID=2609070 RepID=A0AAD8ZQY9_9TELE|nr:hypothetical protein P4O66_003784 [Electrophorus voltai]